MEWSKKIMPIGLVAIVCFVVVISGCTSSNNSTSSSNDNAKVEVATSVAWNGTITDQTGTRSINGDGAQTIDLGSVSGVVSANAQKKDNSANPLTISIYSKEGNIIAINSTSDQQGVAQVSATV